MGNCTGFRLLSVLGVLLTFPVVGQEVSVDTAEPRDHRASDLTKIEAAIESYVAAFNARDVEKLLSHWSPDGVYVSRSSGDQLAGYESLKDEFSAILGSEDAPKLSVRTESIEFVSPNVALERGSAFVTGDDFSEETTYRVVYVEHDGDWLIDRVSEDVVETVASHHEQLEGLEFLVGQWSLQGDGMDGMSVQLDSQWTTNQNYLSRKYSVSIDGTLQSSGLEIIGWDAKHEQIRSWLFDSDGGFVRGEWNERDGVWVVQSVATLSDGSTGSSTNVLTPLDDDSYSWRKINRIVDGQLLPNTEEVTLVRQ